MDNSPMSNTRARDRMPDRLVAGAITVDRAAHLVRACGQPVLVSPTEFRLLDLLVSRADHVVTNHEILSCLWGRTSETERSGTPAVYIRRLRSKLARDGADAHLRTVRGLGYVFDTVPVEPAGGAPPSARSRPPDERLMNSD